MAGRLRAVYIALLGGLIGGGFYLLLIDITDLPELYVLAGVGVACAVAFLLSREQGFTEARVGPRWLAGAWRLVWKIPSDIGIVCWEAVAQLVHPRASRGQFRVAPYAATKQSPEDTGRRAVTEVVGSIAPNTIIVGVDADRGLLLVHQLRRQGKAESLDMMRLG